MNENSEYTTNSGLQFGSPSKQRIRQLADKLGSLQAGYVIQNLLILL